MPSTSNLRQIGPVDVTYRRPSLRWTSDEDAHGIRTCAISGLVAHHEGKRLSELRANPHRRIRVGDHSGTLVYCYFDGDIVGEFRGWYLISNFTHEVEYALSVQGKTGPTPFSLTAAYLGDHRQAVVERSARAKPATFTITPKALVAAPWWSEEPEGEVFTLNPGGVRFTRPYDPTSPFDLLRTAPADGVRDLTIYAGNVTASTDSMKSVVIPNLRTGTDFDGQATPRWLTDRGGDVVGWDRSRGVEVMSEAHSFASTTDIAIGNGMLRFWVGSRGLPPYLTVEALYPGTWTQVGHLLLGGPGELRGVRLVKLTPDEARLALTIQGGGDITVTLKRPDRMVRVGWDTRPPAGAPDRAVSWSGTPPTSRRVAASGAAGKFGQGLAVNIAGATGAVAKQFLLSTGSGTKRELDPTLAGGASSATIVQFPGSATGTKRFSPETTVTASTPVPAAPAAFSGVGWEMDAPIAASAISFLDQAWAASLRLDVTGEFLFPPSVTYTMIVFVNGSEVGRHAVAKPNFAGGPVTDATFGLTVGELNEALVSSANPRVQVELYATVTGAGDGTTNDHVLYTNHADTWIDPAGYQERAMTDLFLRWPSNTPKTAWTKVLWWRPAAAATGPAAGIQTIYDDDGLRAVEVFFDAADDKIKLKIGATPIASSVQTYTAGQDLAIALRFSTTEGMGLSIRTPAGVVEHVVDAAALDPGTTGSYYQWAYLTNPSDWGDGSWGDGVWGGTSTFANGVIDNEMVFDRFLSATQVALLLASTTAVNGLAAARAVGLPEGTLVWYAPFDSRPIPGFSPLTNGITYEATVAGGATRSPDATGLTKGLAYVNPGGSGGIGAFLATTEDEDDLADHQAQFAAESAQSVRIR